MVILNNTTEELKNLFDSRTTSDFSYQYVSTLNEKYKKRRKNNYSSDMKRCDTRIPVKPEITKRIIYENQMEIIEEAWARFNRTFCN